MNTTDNTGGALVSTKYAAFRLRRAARKMRRALDGARTPIERGRMSRQSIWDTALAVTTILKATPTVSLQPLQQATHLQLHRHVHSILCKPVASVCTADVKALHDLIDQIVYDKPPHH